MTNVVFNAASFANFNLSEGSIASPTGQALTLLPASVLAALQAGITNFEATLGGLGGCPFAPGASGNLATEDLAFMLSEMGYELGVDIPKMIELAKYQASAIPTGQFSGHQFRIPDTNE